jgi:hypothetical protein
MNNGWTAGPWRTWEDGIRAATGEHIATVWSLGEVDEGKHYGRGQSDANARLIAAAPELAAELQSVLDDADDTGCDGCAVVSNGQLAKVRALLARLSA